MLPLDLQAAEVVSFEAAVEKLHHLWFEPLYQHSVQAPHEFALIHLQGEL